MTNTESYETHLVLTAPRNRNCRRTAMDEIARWVEEENPEVSERALHMNS
jgi:hypothetical protein